MDTSWQKVSKWYDESVGEKGHYYHREVVIPNVLRLLNLKASDKLLDIACGNGVLAKNIDSEIKYTGVDAATDLIAMAKQDGKKGQEFILGDATVNLGTKEVFDKMAIILALQNLARPDLTLRLAAKQLKGEGKMVIVLNHPVFRIPRQSSWGWDEANKVQYRRIDSYLTSQKIAILLHPGLEDKTTTYSFHWSLQDISKMISGAGLVIEKIEEWISPKKSEGGRAVEEDRSRKEIPLFMALVVRKA